jgi:hypothetical protein
MLSWPALLLAPLVVLGQLSLAYSLVTPSCAGQDRSALHAVAALSLLLVLAMTALAWRGWRYAAGERARFVALVSVIVGALSALVCVALWLPIWLLSPCY